MLLTESFLTSNLGSGLLIRAPPPPFLASLILELLASADFCGRVVLISFDESAVVEGTFVPTTASSPDAVVCGILAAGHEKQNTDYKSKSKIFNKVLDCNKLATYLSIVVCVELRHFRATDRVPFG